MIVSLFAGVTSWRSGGQRGPGADGEGESGCSVAHAAGVRAGHGHDESSVFVVRGGPGIGQAGRGQRVGDGADGGVGDQRGLEGLAHRGDRELSHRVDALGPGGGLVDGGVGPREKLGFVEGAGAGRDDVGHRDLAGVPVRAADGHRGADGGVGQ
jgi:hypothetical protein